MASFLLNVISSMACPAAPYFHLLSHKRMDFRKLLLNIKCVFDFLYDVCLNIFHFKKDSASIIGSTYIAVHVNCPFFLSYCNQT